MFDDFVHFVQDLYGTKEFIPLQPGDVPDTYADSKNLVDQLYYKPSTTVEEGITKFISWYHDYNKP